MSSEQQQRDQKAKKLFFKKKIWMECWHRLDLLTMESAQYFGTLAVARGRRGTGRAARCPRG